MGAMYKLKAYFGMVPAEELAEYADEPRPLHPARSDARCGDYAAEHEPDVREREAATRWDDRYAGVDVRYDAEAAWERRAARIGAWPSGSSSARSRPPSRAARLRRATGARALRDRPRRRPPPRAVRGA